MVEKTHKLIEITGHDVIGQKRRLENFNVGGEALVAIANENYLLGHVNRLKEAGLDIGNDGETQYSYRTEPIKDNSLRLIITRRF